MNRVLRLLFSLLIVRPFLAIFLGLNVRHRERLPVKGPAILVANHNSHLDTAVIVGLFPLRLLDRIRPVAAADYFLRTKKTLAWFALNVVHIIPLERAVRTGHGDPLAAVSAALANGDIVLLFPEGSRGEPERLAEFKTGVAHMAQRHPQVPVTPIFLHGCGKALPRGEAIFVPFFCDVFIGEPLQWQGPRNAFMDTLETRMHALAAEGHFAPWI